MTEKIGIDEELCVKDILKDKGIKMKELAKDIGIAPETLTRALKGNPQYSTLKKVAEYLNVSVRELFRGDEDEKNKNEMKGSLYFNNEMFVFNNREELEKYLKDN